MKKSLKTIGLFVLLMGLMTIFGNSTIRFLQEIFQFVSGIELNEYIRWYSIFFLRKLMHVVGFFWLYKNITNHLGSTVALFITIVIACLDEYVQMFIPGRTSAVTDIFLDITIPVIFFVKKMNTIAPPLR